MRRRHGYIILIMFFCLNAFGQNVVLDASQLDGLDGFFFYPDADGKVLVDPGIFDLPVTAAVSDTATVYPSFPVARPGPNERGGCYGNLDNDPELEIIYTVGANIYAFNMNGTAVNGWPRPLDFPTDGAAAFGDIDGDGFGEIVVTTHQTSTFAFGTIYAFEINGANVLGFPITTDGGAFRTPTLADIDGDGALEIIVNIRKHPEGFIYIYRGNGTLYPEWPVRLDYVPGSAVAVGDITGDDTPEIVAQSYYGLHAFTTEGILMPGFPYYPGPNRVFSYSSPVLADVDGDGLREIICGDHSLDAGDGAVHVVKNDGTLLPGWPKYTGSWIYGPPSVGDINGDDLVDIAVGDQTLSPTPSNQVFAWTAITGNLLPGFPISNIFGVNGQIILADLDGDEMTELMFDDNTSSGKYLGYNHDGTPMDDWPITVEGSTFFINPFVFDIDLNGTMDISGAGYSQASGNTNIYLWNAHVEMDDERAILPILQYNTRHNGVYGDYLMVGTPENTLPARDGKVRVFPNPSHGQITVYYAAGKDIRPGDQHLLEIFSLTGTILHREKLPAAENGFNISPIGLTPGVYILRFTSGDGRSVQSTRLVIIRP